jgi:chemotaxis signal transduction protein
VKTPVSVGEKPSLLRSTFDEAFARPPPARADAYDDFLAVRVAGDPYAFRLTEVRGLVPSRKIVPLPSRRTELLGVAGHRGALVTVYSLGALLGYAGSANSTPWLALAGASDPIGFAFEEFEGFFRVNSRDQYDATESAKRPRHLGDVVRVGDLSRPVVDLPSMLGAIDARAGITGPPEES